MNAGRQPGWASLVGLSLVAAAVGGCADRLTAEQRLWLTRGQEYYEREDYAGAIQTLSRFLAQVSTGPEVAQALYVRGLSNAQAGRRPQAHADLRRCLAVAADPETTWRAHVALGTLHFEDEQWARAAEHYGAAQRLMPPAAPKDAVLFRLGLCCERTGRWRQALEYYGKIAGMFAGGNYAEAARRRLLLRADHFAAQCGAFRLADNAEALCANLRKRGLPAYVRQEPRGRSRLYIVLVGRYQSYAEARRQLSVVRQHVPDAILWP